VELTKRTLELIKRFGTPAKIAAKLALNAVLPGAPVVVEIIGHILDYAHETAKDQLNEPKLKGSDIQGIEKVLDVLDSDLRQLVNSVNFQASSSALATQALEQSLINIQKDHLAALHKLDTAVQGFEQLRIQNENLLKEQGITKENMSALVETLLPQMARLAGISDFLEELKSRNVMPQEVVYALRLYHKGSNELAHGHVERAEQLFGALATKQPASATAATAWAVSGAANCDLEKAQKQLSRAARLKEGTADQDLANLSITVDKLSRKSVLKFVDNLDLTDSSMRGLRALRNLRILSLTRCKNVSDDGLSHLAGFRQLKTLSLNGCSSVTDAGMPYLAGLTSLNELNLIGTAITYRGLGILTAFGNLETLKLTHCKGITDESIQVLRAIPKLKRVHLQGTLVTAKGRQQLPGVNIH